MSGGISQALVTTQLGLSVAIPLVLFHSLLAGRANRMVEKLGKFSSDIVTGRELD
jgi:biopolymer transport protein ExbB